MDTGVIYARFSSQSQNEQSIEAQIRICSEFAENKGIKIVNTYSDKAKSGTNDHRPAFQKMVSDAQTGAFKYHKTPLIPLIFSKFLMHLCLRDMCMQYSDRGTFFVFIISNFQISVNLL